MLCFDVELVLGSVLRKKYRERREEERGGDGTEWDEMGQDRRNRFLLDGIFRGHIL